MYGMDTVSGHADCLRHGEGCVAGERECGSRCHGLGAQHEGGKPAMEGPLTPSVVPVKCL
jgi:hypothetical protein